MKIKKRIKKDIQKVPSQILTEDRLYFGKKKEDVIFPIAPTTGKMPKSYAVFYLILRNAYNKNVCVWY